MSETVIKVEGDVHIISGITKTRQLIEFYNEVVRNNYEKYVGITTEGVKYAYDSVKGTAIRLPKEQEFAVNPNYRPIKVEQPVVEEIREEVKPEPVVEQVVESKIVEPEVNVEPIKEDVVEEQPVVITVPVEPEVDYEGLYKAKCEELTKIIEELEIAKERADFAEKDNTQLREIKVINEGRIEEFKAELERKVAEVSSLTTEVAKLKEDLDNGTHYAEFDTDTLVMHLKNKGYTVSITR